METSILGTYGIKPVSVTVLAFLTLLGSLEALALDVNQALSAENPASAGFFVFSNFCDTLPVTKSQEK
jgi:hypothetical protein